MRFEAQTGPRIEFNEPPRAKGRTRAVKQQRPTKGTTMTIDGATGMNSNMAAKSTPENPKGLEALTRLFYLHWQLAGRAQDQCDNALLETADQIGSVIDTLAERLGCTVDEVTAPFREGAYQPA